MVATASENTLLVAGKGKVSMKAKYTFTENFVIRVSLRFIQFQACLNELDMLVKVVMFKLNTIC